MIKFDEQTNENKIEDISKWPYIPDHPNRILIDSGASGSGKNKLIIKSDKQSP